MYSGGNMNHENLEKFYDEHVDKVYKFFYIKCLDRSTAEDLTSETFVSFTNQIDSKEIEDHKKYLYGIMRNIWLEFLKEKYKAQLTDYESIENFEEYAHNAVNDFEVTEDPIMRLMPYVKKLPEKQRMVVMMRVYENMSVRDTALALEKDIRYVKTTYNRGLNKLRQILNNPYLEEEGVEG